MKVTRLRTVAILMLVALSLAWCTIGDRRNGVFNNWFDEARAIQEHEAEWIRRNYHRSPISRLHMEMFVRVYDGSCITGDAEWERVDMGQRLDPYLAPERKRIECRFPVEKRRLFWIPVRYMWTIDLEPISSNELRVMRMARHRDPLSF